MNICSNHCYSTFVLLCQPLFANFCSFFISFQIELNEHNSYGLFLLKCIHIKKHTLLRCVLYNKTLEMLSYPKNAFGQKQALRMFISTNVDLSTQDILDIYVSRWPIEIFFRSSKSKLGLDTYQIRSQKWIERYWLIMSLMHYLCCICKGGYCSFEAFMELLHLPLRPLADRTEDVPIQPAVQM